MGVGVGKVLGGALVLGVWREGPGGKAQVKGGVSPCQFPRAVLVGEGGGRRHSWQVA